MATNEILPFASTNTGTNLLTQSEYTSDAQRTTGNQPGIARSKLVNKALRQASIMSAGLAEFIADYQANNVQDGLTQQQVADYLVLAIRGALPTGEQNFTSSGVFTVPANVTKIIVEVWGGGGGGGGGDGGAHSGGGGGGGGYTQKRISGLTPGSTIPVTIGAAGLGGAPGYSGTAGSTTSFGSYCSATGGDGGDFYPGSSRGSLGGLGINGNLNLNGDCGDPSETTVGGGGGSGARGGAGGLAGYGAGTAGAGGNGFAPGGGGGGADGGGNGGNGAKGGVFIHWGY